ncbi:ribonuclease H-like domain-containing protein [Phlebopus sp. FC_14]|nr:ribonuclease H-like domain-containing protein [Phlebopus sp. FC_14]
MRIIQKDEDSSDWSIEIFDGDHYAASRCTDSQVADRNVKESKPIHPFFSRTTYTDTSSLEREVQPQESKASIDRLEGKETRRSTDAPWTTSSRLRSTKHSEKCWKSAEMPAMPAVDVIRRGVPPVSSAAAGRQKPNRKQLSSTKGSWNVLDKAGLEGTGKGAQLNNTQHKNKTATSNGKARVTKRGSFSLSSGKGDSLLPLYSFTDSAAAVVYTQDENEANELVQSLKSPLGFDLEWRVMWQAGAQERRTALVQLCDQHTILLIQVSSMKRFPQKVVEVIESGSIVKTGANIMSMNSARSSVFLLRSHAHSTDDGGKLYRDFGICARGLVELGALAKKADDNFTSVYNREIVSLAKMVAMYLGKTLLKGKVRTSNWEADLNSKMVEYAANDCHSALMVHNKLLDVAAQCGKNLLSASHSCEVNPRLIKWQETPPVPSEGGRSSVFSEKSLPGYCIPEAPRPQYLRAYNLWHKQRMPLDEMCMTLKTGGRVEPLKESTVISYVIGALQADASLAFDIDTLKQLVQMEAGSWQRHRHWILSKERIVKGVSEHQG